MSETGWTNERVQRLRDLWKQEVPAKQIADELGGTTRNAVIGKAHRLGLEERASPITRKGAPRPAKRPSESAGLARPVRTGPSCSWPIGDLKDPGFHFCGAPAALGRPYCSTHAAEAYTTPAKGDKRAA